MRTDLRELVGITLFVAVVAAIPLLTDSGVTLNFVMMALYAALLAQAWNILGGFGGQFSFGHALFFGTGAYIQAVAQLQGGLSPWAALALAVSGSAIIGLGVGALTFRYGLRGSYFALVTLAFAEVFRILALSVPFTGAGPAVVALLGGQIEAVSSGPATVLQHIKAGKLRVLAHWGQGRLASMPEVPGIKDSGLNVEYAQWSGLFIPQATPEPIAQRLRAAAKAAAQDAKVIEIIKNAGSPILYQDTAEFEKYVQVDALRMADVVKRIGKLD